MLDFKSKTWVQILVLLPASHVLRINLLPSVTLVFLDCQMGITSPPFQSRGNMLKINQNCMFESAL